MMNNEKDFSYELYVDVQLLNEYQTLKPHAYQTLFGSLADTHLTNFNLNVDTTMKHNLAWALISLSVEIEKNVDKPMKLYGKTWHSEKKGPFFRREYLFTNEQGETMFKGSSYSVLLDVTTRTIYRKKELPFFVDKPFEETTITAAPSFKDKHVYDRVHERIAFSSFIDCLGHVNNCRYGEFAYDALNELECANIINLKRMDIYFLSELRKNDIFTVLKASENNKIFVRGHNNSKNDISFDVNIEFKE